MKAILPPGTLKRLEALLSQAKKINDESVMIARAISVELRAVALAINSAQQVKLPLEEPRRPRRTNFNKALADLREKKGLVR